MLSELLGHVRALHRNTCLYLISNAIQAVSAGALAVLYTLYLASLGYNTSFIGLVLDVGIVGGGLGVIPASALVHRLGWRATLIWSDVIGALALAVQLVWPVTPVILITTVGVGASVALLLVVNTPLLTAYSPEAERTAVFGLSNALVFLGGVGGTLLGGELPAWFALPAVRDWPPLAALDAWLVVGAQARTYELALLATGVLALPSIIPVLLLTRARPPGAADLRGRTATGGRWDPRALLRRVWPRAAQWERVWAVARGTIGRFSATQVLVGVGAGLFGPYLNLYFVKQLHASTVLYGQLAAGLAVLLAVASLAIVPVARRIGTIRSAVVVQALSLPFLLALGFAPTLAIAAGAFLIRGPLMNAASPPLQTYLMGSVPHEQRVLASSVYTVSSQIATGVGAGLGGLLIAQLGYGFVFSSTAGLYAASIALLVVWFGHRGRMIAPGPPPSAAEPPQPLTAGPIH
jgi:MFS family permease